MNDKDFFGLPSKTWTMIVLYTLLIAAILFLALPFLLSLIIPTILQFVYPNNNYDYKYIVDTLDGIAFLVGLLGTVASVLSIMMTLADKKRYTQEKTQTESLIKSIHNLHKEINVVNKYVKQTFEQNQRLGLELYNRKIIGINPNWGVGVCEDGQSNQSPQWEEMTMSGEIENE